MTTGLKATAGKLLNVRSKAVPEKPLTMLWTEHRLNNAGLLRQTMPWSGKQHRYVRLAMVAVGYAKTTPIGPGEHRTISVWRLAGAALASHATATPAGYFASGSAILRRSYQIAAEPACYLTPSSRDGGVQKPSRIGARSCISRQGRFSKPSRARRFEEASGRMRREGSSAAVVPSLPDE